MLDNFANRTVIVRLYCNQAFAVARRTGSTDQTTPIGDNNYYGNDCRAGNNQSAWSPPLIITLDGSGDFDMRFGGAAGNGFGNHSVACML